MTKEELLTGYKEYIKTVPSINSSDSTYGTYLNKVPFDYFDKVMSYWKVTSKNREQIVGNTNSDKECDSTRTYYLWQYFKDNIKPILEKGDNFDYLELVVKFINDGDILYALTIVDIVTGISELANRFYYEYKKKMSSSIDLPKPKKISSETKYEYFIYCKHALRLLRDWLQLNTSFVQNANPHSSLDDERNKIRPELVYKIDGALALAREIGIDKFIQYAIDQSYFFEPKIVELQMDEIVKTYTKKHENDDFDGQLYDLYARSSKNESLQKSDGNSNDNESRRKKINIERSEKKLPEIKEKLSKPVKFALFNDVAPYAATKYPIVVDADGNRKLRDVIEDYTGYTVSEGKESIFQNYRLSHIWGRAFDPRFFTNLWNVVLVPAWANDLLDKPNPSKGSLESKLKSTIQRICEVLYFRGINSWSSINIPQPNVINRDKNGNDDRVWPNTIVTDVVPKNRIIDEDAVKIKNAPVKRLPYLINIIEGKGDKTLGDIVKYAVYV